MLSTGEMLTDSCMRCSLSYHIPEKDKKGREGPPTPGPTLTLPPYRVLSAAVDLPSNLWKVL